MRVYQLTDNDLPRELYHIRRIFLDQPPRRFGPGYEKAKREAERIRKKNIQTMQRKKQGSLL